MSSNNRASLLAGLRTGGVRQPSQVPQTAAPNVSSFSHLDMPMTASVNGGFNVLSAQAQAQARAQVQQQQALQMQMMQMEILRLQVCICLFIVFPITRPTLSRIVRTFWDNPY